MVFGAVNDFRQTLNATEQRWQRRQWQQASLSGMAQALMILASGLTVTLLLWLTAAGIGGDTQPGALIALFVFAALASFEALMPVAGAFQHLGGHCLRHAGQADHRSSAGGHLPGRRPGRRRSGSA